MKLCFNLRKFLSLSYIAAIGFFLCSSCARQISPNVYDDRTVGEISTTYTGIIKNVRVVSAQNGDQLENNGLGIAGGGFAGGVLGNSIGRGGFLPTAGGAIVGAVAGSLIERKAKQQSALEYVVFLDNGNMITVVQGEGQVFSIGQQVYVIVSQSGRSRIIGS